MVPLLRGLGGGESNLLLLQSLGVILPPKLLGGNLPPRFWESFYSPSFGAAFLGGCRSSGRGSRRSLHSAAPCAREPFSSVLEVPRPPVSGARPLHVWGAVSFRASLGGQREGALLCGLREGALLCGPSAGFGRGSLAFGGSPGVPPLLWAWSSILWPSALLGLDPRSPPLWKAFVRVPSPLIGWGWARHGFRPLRRQTRGP